VEAEMDIYELLKSDHDKVREILEKLKQSSGEKDEEREQLLNELRTELFKHNQAEEETFYKELQGYSETKDKVSHSEEEHEKVETYLINLESPKMNEKERESVTQIMREELLHHIEEEENELFSKAQKLISKERSTKLGEEFENAKREIDETEDEEQ